MTLRSAKARGAFFVAGIAGAVLALSGCGGVPGDSVAIMDGNPITTAAFKHWLYVAAKGQAAQSPGSPVIVPDPPDYKRCVASLRSEVTGPSVPNKTLKSDCQAAFQQLRDQVLEFLIRSYWYQAEAAAQHVTISSKQVQQTFQTEKQQQFPSDVQFKQFLQETGQTQQDILFRVRVNELYKRLINKHTAPINAATMQAYYNAHPSQFGTPESRNIRLVLTKTRAQAEKAMAALNGGQSWKSVAKQYSTDPATKDKGGLLVGVTRGQEDQALEAAAFSASAQQLKGPVKGQFGYYVFKVTSIHKATQVPYARATKAIRLLMQQKGQADAQSAVDSYAQKKFRNKTECRSGYVMADCKGYKAPKGSTSSTPGATSTAP